MTHHMKPAYSPIPYYGGVRMGPEDVASSLVA